MKGRMSIVATLAAFLVFVILMYFRFEVSAYLSNPASRVDLGNVFSAIFDWSSIQTGFLFAVYGYIAGKGDGFVGAIRHTPFMGRFAGLLKLAIGAGFFLTLISMGLLIYPITASIGWEYTMLSLVAGLFSWAFSLFCLVAYRFGIIVNTPDQRGKAAG